MLLIQSVFSFRLFGVILLAAAFVAAGIGYGRARSHIKPVSSLPATPTLILGDKSFGETYWLVPGLSSEFGLIQFTGSPYRPRHTNIYFGICIASLPLTIPWLLAVVALAGVALFLLFQRSRHDRAPNHLLQ
jgi:hypothetical protein